jgi:hypothetical protein
MARGQVLEYKAAKTREWQTAERRWREWRRQQQRQQL